MTARVALVLGAGGTVGHGFHAGVLAALADVTGWDASHADVLVGTSAGSIVASLLRAGMPADDLARRIRRQPLSAHGQAVAARAGLRPPGGQPLPRERPRGRSSSPRLLARALRAPWDVWPGAIGAAALPAGHIPTDDIGAPFHALFGDTWPARALWIVAVDLETGKRTVFGRDAVPVTVGDAVRASCAIPAFFEPAEIDGRRYIDGGVASTTNADLVGTERPDLVVVSAPMSAARGVRRLGPAGAIRQFARLSLAREVAALRGRRVPVLTFQPTADDLDVMAGDSLDPAKLAPVLERVQATATARLRRPDVAARLAALTG